MGFKSVTRLAVYIWMKTILKQLRDVIKLSKNGLLFPIIINKDLAFSGKTKFWEESFSNMSFFHLLNGSTKQDDSSFFHNSRLITGIQQKTFRLDQGLNPDHLFSCQSL